MRLKLVLIASLIAAVAGAGSAIAIVLFLFSSLDAMSSPGLAVATYLLPVLSTLFASMFVYRHTARRRKLQAALTVMISFVLTLGVFLAASMLTARSTPEQSPQPQRNVG